MTYFSAPRFLLILAASCMSFGASAAEGSAPEVHAPIPPAQDWSFSGPLGTFDRAQLQRGFQVYRDVCASCHSLNLVSYRNLSQPGGPEIPVNQVKVIAAEKKIGDLDDAGQPMERDAKPSDRMPNPFPNTKAAASANGGKAPPDLSVMTKARTTPRGFPTFVIDFITGKNIATGPDYVHGILVGYEDAPAGQEMPAGTYYNAYYPGHAIAMPKPLSDGQVPYQDGSPQTVDQYAKDVTAFLMWTAEPKLEERKRIGLQVMIFMILFAGLLYFTKKKIWSDVPH